MGAASDASRYSAASRWSAASVAGFCAGARAAWEGEFSRRFEGKGGDNVFVKDEQESTRRQL